MRGSSPALLFSFVASTVCFVIPARADFTVCNKTAARLGVAVGHQQHELWTTEGWWTLPAGGCEAILPGPLTNKFYYIYARDWASGEEWAGTTPMCVHMKEFTIKGVEDCPGRGYETRGFLEVDTEQDATWTVELTPHSEVRQSDPAPTNPPEARIPSIPTAPGASPFLFNMIALGGALVAAGLVARRTVGWVWGLVAVLAATVVGWLAGTVAGWEFVHSEHTQSTDPMRDGRLRLVGTAFWYALGGAAVGVWFGRKNRLHPDAERIPRVETKKPVSVRPDLVDDKPLAQRLGEWLSAPFLLGVFVYLSGLDDIEQIAVTLVFSVMTILYLGSAKDEATGSVVYHKLWTQSIMLMIWLGLGELILRAIIPGY